MIENEKPTTRALEQKIKIIIRLSLVIFFTLQSALYLWISVVSQKQPFFEYNYLILIPASTIQIILMTFLILLAWLYMKEEKRIASITLSSIALGISSLPTITLFYLIYTKSMF